MYQADSSVPENTDGGLYGAIIVYRPGELLETGTKTPHARDVDKEFVISFNSIVEGHSAYVSENVHSVHFESEDVLNLASVRFAVNGFSFCNLPGLKAGFYRYIIYCI